jgi:hypothetical protein
MRLSLESSFIYIIGPVYYRFGEYATQLQALYGIYTLNRRNTTA